MASQCPYCGETAEDAHEEIEHMQSRHPEVIEARLSAAGISHFEGLPIIGHDRALLDGLVETLRKSIDYSARGPYQTRRGSRFEILVPGTKPRERDRIYRIEVTLMSEES